MSGAGGTAPGAPGAPEAPAGPARGRRVVVWVALAVVAVVASVVAALGLADDDGAASPSPTGSPVPTATTGPPPSPTGEPGPVVLPTTTPVPVPTDPGDGSVVGFLPDVAVHEFVVDQAVLDAGMAVEVSGIRISGMTSTGPDTAGYLVEGEGFAPIVVNAAVGTVVEVPGWGRLALTQVEWVETGGRPDLAFRFAAQTEHALEVVAVDP